MTDVIVFVLVVIGGLVVAFGLGFLMYSFMEWWDKRKEVEV